MKFQDNYDYTKLSFGWKLSQLIEILNWLGTELNKKDKRR